MDIPNLASTVFYFLLVLSVLVLVHEIGHFVFARKFGVRVEEFGLGYPPRALTLWHGSGWIQLQGKRIVIPRKIELPDSIQLGSWVVYKTVLENGRETLSAIDPVDTESRGLTLASQVQALDRGTVYTLNWLPLGGFVRMTGEENPSDPQSFAAAAPWKRVIILCAGVAMNALLAIVLFAIIEMVGLPKPIEFVSVNSVAPGSPAEQAGLRPGDRILSIDGVTMENRQDVLVAAHNGTGQPITIELRRGTDNVVVTLTPRVNPPKNEGPIGIVMDARLIRQDVVSHPVWEAIPMGVQDTTDTIALIANGFYRMFAGTAPVEVGGPVLIAQATGYVAQEGLVFLMQLAAQLSVNLAILNIIPFPALDGGRLLFVLIEIVRRGKRVSPEKEGIVHFVGMMVLLALMVLVSLNDIRRVLGG